MLFVSFLLFGLIFLEIGDSQIVSFEPKTSTFSGGEIISINIIKVQSSLIKSVFIGESSCPIAFSVDLTLFPLKNSSGNIVAIGSTQNGQTTLPILQIRCEIPALVNVTTNTLIKNVDLLVNYGSDTLTSSKAFSYCQNFFETKINSVSPSMGSDKGGTTISIIGENLGFNSEDIDSIKIGTFECTNIIFYNSSFITCITPSTSSSSSSSSSESKGTMYVNVITKCAGNSIVFGRFTYIATPADTIGISSIFPTFGPNTGGTEVNLKGFGFRNFGRLMKCKFGNVLTDARIKVEYGEMFRPYNGTSITCFSPPICNKINCDKQCKQNYTSCHYNCLTDNLEYSNTLCESNYTTCNTSCISNKTECINNCNDVNCENTCILDENSCSLNCESSRTLCLKNECSDYCNNSFIDCSLNNFCEENFNDLEYKDCVANTTESVAVEFSLNGKTFTNNGVMFNYHTAIEIESISPQEGELSGNTLLTLNVAGKVIPEYITTNGIQTLQTTIPNAKCKFGTFKAFQNHQQSNSSQSVHHFPHFTLTDATVKINNQGKIISAECYSPRDPNIGKVYVYLSLNNGIDFTEQNENIYFDYYNNWSFGQTSGTTPSSRWLHTFTKVGSDIYLFGGFGKREKERGLQGGTYLNDLFVLRSDGDQTSYYPSSFSSDLKWIELGERVVIGEFPSPRAYHTTSNIEDKYLIVFGGVTDSNITFPLHKVDYVEALQVETVEVERFVVPNPYRIPETETETNIDYWRVVEERTENLLKQFTITILSEFGSQNEIPMIVRDRKATSVYIQRFTTLNDVHVFDTITREWISSVNQIGDQPHSRLGHSATVVSSTIYVFGGWSLTQCAEVHPIFNTSQTLPCPVFYNDLYELTPDMTTMTMNWKLLSPNGQIPSPRYGHTANYKKFEGFDFIFVFGGIAQTPLSDPSDQYTYTGTETNELYAYDILKNTWSLVLFAGNSVPIARSLHTATIVESLNKIVIFGGKHQGGWLDDVYTLDIQTSNCENAGDLSLVKCLPYSNDNASYGLNSDLTRWEILNDTKLFGEDWSGDEAFQQSLLCCPATPQSQINFCTQSNTFETCTRAFWKKLQLTPEPIHISNTFSLNTSSVPGIRCGHTAENVGDELYLFGGASPTLQPNFLYILNFDKFTELVIKPFANSSRLFTAFPSSTAHHTHFDYDDVFLYTLWDPDKETICLDNDTRSHCQQFLPAPAGGIADRLINELPMTPISPTEYHKYKKGETSQQLASGIKTIEVTSQYDKPITESQYNFRIYNP